MMSKTPIGIIGCGNISSVYFKAPQIFDNLQVVACADIDMERARSQAEKFGVPHVYTVEELLADPDIEIVVNLTVPNAHAEIAQKAIAAGKAVYGEKPLAIKRADGYAVLEAARARQVRIGNAPDTFLGGGFQTCIKAINDGQIGAPIAATAFVLNHGMEHWHPDPYFFFQPGAGPLFDIGPYYITALIAMMGPIQRVTASMQTTFPERIVTSGQKYGTKIPVNTPTHIAGIMEFASGAIGTILTSFDVWHHRLPFIEIYGTEGSLSTPDPNRFDGPVYLRRAKDEAWREVSLTHGYTSNSRGLGIADMAYAMRSGRPHRANGEMAYHVLDTMESLMQSAQEGRHVTLTSTCARPDPLNPGMHIWEEEQAE
ncbi:MAG TPA: Gfo/Idh/MocA family oxidoreductase [Ktedonobacteraceae bacterium]|nr:Gfo/Idh/MocA family oxidoreductase [Ktedonobacteraceae bacterium]